MSEYKKISYLKPLKSIFVLILCFILTFNINLSQSYGENVIKLDKGETKTLYKSYTQNGYWKIDDESIVKKETEGIKFVTSGMYNYIEVKGLRTGSTNIKFYSTSGNILLDEVINVTTSIKEFKISQSKAYISLYEEKRLSVKINPEDADAKDIYWESSNTGVAEVDSNGTIKPKSIGQATITAKSSDNIHSAKCVVNVVKESTSIEVEDTDILINNRLEKKQIKAKVYPEDATYRNVTFESSDTNIVKVDENGYLEGVNNGIAIITIKSEDNYSTFKKEVTVKGLVENITLNKDSIELNDVGETFKIQAAINPEDAIDKSVQWSSSDKNIATVSQEGLVTAKSVGQCKIYATSNDKIINAVANVKVNPLLNLNFYEVEKYDENGSTHTHILPSKNVKNNSTIKLEIPRKDGHKFDGWYRNFHNGNYTNLVKNNEISINSDTDLFAKFSPIEVTGIKLTKESLWADSKYLRIEGEFTPGYVANGKYTVKSSNTKVAVVENTGVQESYGDNNKNIIVSDLIVKGTGSTTITVTSQDGNYTASKKITIGKDDIYNEIIIVNETLPKTSLSMNSDNSIKISFPNYKNALYYELFAKDSLGNEWSIIINNPKQGSYIDKNAIRPNVTYSYKMKVHFGDGIKTKCGLVSSLKMSLAKPSFTFKSKNYNSVDISIKKVENAKGYKIYRSTDKRNWKYINTTSSLNYTDTKLTTGKTYYYRIMAYNGSIKSSYSNIVSAKAGINKPKVKAQSYSYNSNKITWDNVSGASGYIVYRSTSKSGKYSQLKVINSSSTLSYNNTKLLCGKTYYYKVKAFRTVSGKKQYSSYSDVVNSKSVPSTPSINLLRNGKNRVIKWSKISGASGYEVYRSTSNSGNYGKIKTINSSSTTSYKDTKLNIGRKYYYKVRAYKTVKNKKIYSTYSSIKY